MTYYLLHPNNSNGDEYRVFIDIQNTRGREKLKKINGQNYPTIQQVRLFATVARSLCKDFIRTFHLFIFYIL